MPDSERMFTLPLFLGTEWHTCIAHFLRSIYGRSQSSKSLRNYRLILTQFFSEKPNKMPEMYSRADIEDFLYRPCQALRNHGGEPSVSTRNVRLCVLSSFYRYASAFVVNAEPLLRKPSPTLGIPYGKPAMNPRALSQEQIERFFAVIPTDTVLGLRDRAIFLTFLLTARRRSEICRLTYGDIEPYTFVEHGHVRRGYRYRFVGKARAGQFAYRELPELARVAIWRYLQASGRLASIAPTDPLFVAIGPHGGRKHTVNHRPLHSDAVVYALKKYARVAGLEIPVSLHWFRHTAVVQRLELGQDLLAVMHIGDWRSLDSFYRYTQRLQSTADSGASLLEARFGHLARCSQS